MNADIHTLTGAYAVNALPTEERVDFERHLRMCSACEEEVRELQATAALLAVAAAITPPPALRERVMAGVGRVRQVGPDILPGIREARPERRRTQRFGQWPQRAVALGAAALVLAVAGLGVLTYQQRQELATQRATIAGMAELNDLLAAVDARLSSVTTDEAIGTVIASKQQNKAVFLSSGLPEVASNRTYQLWVITAEGTNSVGLLQRSEGGTTAPALATGTSGARSLAVTVEPAGGSIQPTTQPVLLVELPA